MTRLPAENVDAYIAESAPEARERLEQMRQTIRAAAPEAIELIAYAMPAYKLAGKPLVYFGSYKNHIGFYATPTGHAAFADELSRFKQGKGSVQFPLAEPLPLDLVARITAFRAAEVVEKAKLKKPKN